MIFKLKYLNNNKIEIFFIIIVIINYKLVKMPRHIWTKDDIRVVFATCKANPNNKERRRILQSLFPDCNKNALSMQIRRYQCRNDGKLRWEPEKGICEGWGANGNKHQEVWLERDWRMIVE